MIGRGGAVTAIERSGRGHSLRLVLLALAAVVVAPVGTPTTAVAGAATLDTVTVGPAANGGQRTLRPGDRLVVRLPANPSTGYVWTVRSAARPVLAAVGRAFVPPADRSRVGAPGTAVLRYRVAAVGRATLRLAYVRPWEHGVAPARTFTLRVVARA